MNPDDALRELDRAALGVLGGGRVDALVPKPDEYAGVDFTDHPWAELVVAAAFSHARRYDDAEHLLADAEARFGADNDRRGLGWLAFVRATMALGRGQLDLLEAHLEEVGLLLDGVDHPPADSIAHMGLAAFHRGDTREAILLADRALSLARTTGNRRHEGVALVYLAYFEFWRGRFARVGRLIDAAEDTYADMADRRDAFELPIVLGLRATLHAMRGQTDEADAQYEAALGVARDLGVEWFEAIVLGQRAHFMSATHPRRSRTDARRSYERLVEMGDEWWQVWALRAQGMVETALGNHAAAESVLQTALERSPGLQERALTLIAVGTNLLELGQPARAAVVLQECMKAAREVDVGFVVAWAASLLGRAEPERADHWLRIVHEHDDGDPAYVRLLATDLRITVLGDAGVWRGANRVPFATRHAESAVFSLAVAEDHTIHAEILAERLWPDAPADRVGGRLATLVWQIRRGLGPDSWRLRRQNDLLRLDCRGLEVDVVTLRRVASELLTATEVNMPAARAAVAALSRPVLPSLQYENWVQQAAGQLAVLADRLEAILPP